MGVSRAFKIEAGVLGEPWLKHFLCWEREILVILDMLEPEVVHAVWYRRVKELC